LLHNKGEVLANSEENPHIPILTRNLDIQNISEQEFNNQCTNLLRLYHRFLEYSVEEHSVKLTLIIQIIFDVIATIGANIFVTSNPLLTQIEKISSIISESDFIDEENFNKFNDYYGSRDAFCNFKDEFDSITDDEKNDALYFYPDEQAQNLYFVHLTIIPESDNPDGAAKEKYQKYLDEKRIRMVNHYRLSTRLNKKLLNVKLARKSFNINKEAYNLSISSQNWIFQGEDYRGVLKIIAKNTQAREVLEKVEATMHLLFNIFNSHFAIKNSFDTHFIVSHIVKLNKIAIISRQQLEEKLHELQNQSKNNESFNPFIEIGDNQEENKFVDLKEQDFDQEAMKILESLDTLREFIDMDMAKWLSIKHEKPLFMLHLHVQQQNLRQKLKWEQKYNSKDKLNKLKKMIRGYRKR